MSLSVSVNKNDHLQGDHSAPLVLVEYGDYECPYCGEAYPVVKQLQRYFKERLLFVFRNFPLSEMHPNALVAAYVAEAAGLQKKFWSVHDVIFEHQQSLSPDKLIEYAQSAGADIDQLVEDANSAKIAEKVEGDLESGARSGVNGTPTFFINGKRHEGSYEFDELVAAMEARL